MAHEPEVTALLAELNGNVAQLAAAQPKPAARPAQQPQPAKAVKTRADRQAEIDTSMKMFNSGKSIRTARG